MEVGRAFFETPKKRYTILDAPGHKSYVPNMISGAAQADVGVLVISARKGEFETGFERGGQTREHAQLAKTLGVQRLVVVVNKMDDPTTVGEDGVWSRERFDEVEKKLTLFLKGSGYNPKKDLAFLPISGLFGHNIKDRVDPKLCPWYKVCTHGWVGAVGGVFTLCFQCLVGGVAGQRCSREWPGLLSHVISTPPFPPAPTGPLPVRGAGQRGAGAARRVRPLPHAHHGQLQVGCHALWARGAGLRVFVTKRGHHERGDLQSVMEMEGVGTTCLGLAWLAPASDVSCTVKPRPPHCRLLCLHLRHTPAGHLAQGDGDRADGQERGRHRQGWRLAPGHAHQVRVPGRWARSLRQGGVEGSAWGRLPVGELCTSVVKAPPLLTLHTLRTTPIPLSQITIAGPRSR